MIVLMDTVSNIHSTWKLRYRSRIYRKVLEYSYIYPGQARCFEAKFTRILGFRPPIAADFDLVWSKNCEQQFCNFSIKFLSCPRFSR